MSVKQDKRDEFSTHRDKCPNNGSIPWASKLPPTTSRQSTMLQTFRFSNPLCLVNLNLLAKALWCNNCNIPLSLLSCLEEKPWRDSTCLRIDCDQCHHTKCIVLCNENPEDDLYHDPESSNDVSQDICGIK